MLLGHKLDDTSLTEPWGLFALFLERASNGSDSFRRYRSREAALFPARAAAATRVLAGAILASNHSSAMSGRPPPGAPSNALAPVPDPEMPPCGAGDARPGRGRALMARPAEQFFPIQPFEERIGDVTVRGFLDPPSEQIGYSGSKACRTAGSNRSNASKGGRAPSAGSTIAPVRAVRP